FRLLHLVADALRAVFDKAYDQDFGSLKRTLVADEHFRKQAFACGTWLSLADMNLRDLVAAMALELASTSSPVLGTSSNPHWHLGSSQHHSLSLHHLLVDLVQLDDYLNN